jgi:hypothetical protein
MRAAQGRACDVGAFGLELELEQALRRVAAGVVRLDYTLQASQTNEVSVSASLADWETLATRVSDENGHFELEDALAAPGSRAPNRA